MFEYMTSGVWNISTSIHGAFAEDMHGDKIASLLAELNASQVNYNVWNETANDTKITTITIQETC